MGVGENEKSSDKVPHLPISFSFSSFEEKNLS